MNILLYVPDNQVADNFVPQLWPFVLERLTPEEHKVTIIDGNVFHYDEARIIEFIRRHRIDIVGMGFMTRMAQKAYRMAAAIREGTAVPIVMGGPHVTAMPDEALGRQGGPQYADAVVLGEADNNWPDVVRDASQGKLKSMYQAETVNGKPVKPSLKDYPIVAWDQMDLDRFDLMRFVPNPIQSLLGRLGIPFKRAFMIPVESGRGCPYGCEFCTVTGYFGDEVRFRENANLIAELRRLKEMGRREKALVMVFFVDDNFAINRERTKALLRQMIAEDACLPWVGQVSINLLRDEELVKLMAASGCRWIFIGLESMEPDSLKEAHKGFNKPEEYASILNLLAKYNLYAIASFIYGFDADSAGVSKKTLETIDTWPSVLPVFGLLTPYPGTSLYDRLAAEGRLSRPRHWLDFRAFKTTYIHPRLTQEALEGEIRNSWRHCYKPAAFRCAQKWLKTNRKGFGYQFMHFVSRLFFRGIYFPQRSRWAWIRLLLSNSPTILSLVRSGIRERRKKY
jgi:radical SAM superfamily enzyme YgiQ (UPF0313 family)